MKYNKQQESATTKMTMSTASKVIFFCSKKKQTLENCNKKYDLASELRNSNHNLFNKGKLEDKYFQKDKQDMKGHGSNMTQSNNNHGPPGVKASKLQNTEKYYKKTKKSNSNLTGIPTTMTPKGYHKINFHSTISQPLKKLDIVKSMTASDFLREKIHKFPTDDVSFTVIKISPITKNQKMGTEW